MKYVYGKRIKTLRDRITTGIAALAIIANSAGVALPFLLTQRVAADPMQSITMTRFSTYNEEPPSMGIAYQFSFNGFTDAKDVDVYIERASGGTVIKSMRDDKVDGYVNGGSELSGRIFVKEMPGKTEDSSSSWERVRYADGTPGNVQWTAATVPTFAWAVITNNDNTTVASAKIPFTETYHGTTPYQDVLPNSPIITHIDAYYNVKTSPVGKTFKGIGVDFRTQFINAATNLELRINREDNSTFSATAKQSVLDAINGEAFKQTPTTRSGVITIQPGDYVGSWEQSATPWAGSSAPKSVDIIITLRDGSTLSLRDESISENIATQAEVLPAEPSLSFVANYIDNAQYGGISLEIVTPDLTDGMGVEITVDRTNGAPDTWSNKPAGSVMPALNGGSHTVTAPIVIAEKTRTRTSSGSWQTTSEPWTSDQEPTYVTVRVNRAGGPTLEQTVSLIGSPWGATWPQIAAQLPVSDTTAPLAVINTPANNSLFNGGVLSVTGHVSDNIGMSHYSMYLYNGTVDLSDGEVHSSSRITTPGGWTAGGQTNVAGLLNQDVSRTLDLSLLDDGEYQIRLAVRDLAGNRNATDSVDVVRFTVDKTAPEVSGVVLNGEAVNIARDTNCGPTDFNIVGGTVNLSATITDNLSGVKKAVYKIRKVTNGGCTQTAIYQSNTVNMSNSVADEWVTLPGSELDTAGIPGGNYTIQMTVTDNADNTATKYVDITVDNTAPAQPQILGIYKGHNNNTDNLLSCGGVTNSTQIRIDWDDVDGAEYYWFGTKLNPKHKKVTVSHYNGNMTPGNNPYFYTVIAVDAAGNESPISAQCSLTLDQEAPDAFNVSPANNSVVNGTSITQEWGSSAGDVAYYIYESYHDAGATSLRWQEVIASNSKTATNVANTTYWWRVKAVDLAGNVGAWSELWKLTVNNTVAPTLSANYFTVHEDHLGVGFSIDNFVDATKVEVKVFDADDNLVTSNIGDSIDMLNLLNSHSGEISSPFYIPFQDPTDGYWNFGNPDWEGALPAYSQIIIHYGTGETISDTVDFLPTNQDSPQFTYQALLNNLDNSRGVFGVSTDTPNSTNGIGLVNRLTNGGPKVLGSSTGVLASTGTQNGGLVILGAISLIAVAFVTLRRKVTN